MKFISETGLSDIALRLQDTSQGSVRVALEKYSCASVSQEKRLFKTRESQWASGMANGKNAWGGGGGDDHHVGSAGSTSSFPSQPSSSLTTPTGATAGSGSDDGGKFGRIMDIASRRILFYLIATLNASFPDYDFGELGPDSFKRHQDLGEVQVVVDSQLSESIPEYRVVHGQGTMASGSFSNSGVPGSTTAASLQSALWSNVQGAIPLEVFQAQQQQLQQQPQFQTPQHPQLMMMEAPPSPSATHGLDDVQIFSYVPDVLSGGPFSDSVWSFNYFFFDRKANVVLFFYAVSRSIRGTVAGLDGIIGMGNADEDYDDDQDMTGGSFTY